MPSIKQEVPLAPLGPPVEHFPDVAGKYHDAVHLFWATEVIGSYDSKRPHALQMYTWMNAMDLLWYAWMQSAMSRNESLPSHT